jgi:hypothetical protein
MPVGSNRRGVVGCLPDTSSQPSPDNYADAQSVYWERHSGKRRTLHRLFDWFDQADPLRWHEPLREPRGRFLDGSESDLQPPAVPQLHFSLSLKRRRARLASTWTGGLMNSKPQSSSLGSLGGGLAAKPTCTTKAQLSSCPTSRETGLPGRSSQTAMKTVS